MYSPDHSSESARYDAVIFDVDGVLVASPHEQAWRQALEDLMASDWRHQPWVVPDVGTRFSTDVYQGHVAGKPRLDGARAALAAVGAPADDPLALALAERKQRRIEQLIDAGEFVAFPDGLRFALAAKALGLRLGVASSSKNANAFMTRIRLDDTAGDGGAKERAPEGGETLLSLFDANVCGRPVPQGKPHPAIFLLAADELGVEPRLCVVVEDAPSGVQAARAAGMGAIGVARLRDEELLEGAGADLVVDSLDEVAVDALPQGRLERLSTASGRHDRVAL